MGGRDQNIVYALMGFQKEQRTMKLYDFYYRLCRTATIRVISDDRSEIVKHAEYVHRKLLKEAQKKASNASHI